MSARTPARRPSGARLWAVRGRALRDDASGDLGADVVKVEPPRGDEWRRYDPFQPGESRYFYALNRGKRSIALDLKTAEGRERSRG